MQPELGKRLELELIDGNDARVYVRGVCNALVGNLLTLTTDEGDRTFNTTSSALVSIREWKKPEGSVFKAMSAPADTRMSSAGPRTSLGDKLPF